jgi:hypothetical protein
MLPGAFLTSLLEPIFYKRKVIGYEVFFGLLGTLATMLNGKYVAKTCERTVSKRWGCSQGQKVLAALVLMASKRFVS